MFYMGIRRVDYCISAVILPAEDYSKTIQISIVLIYEVCVVTIYHITLQEIISFIEKYQPDNASLTNLSKIVSNAYEHKNERSDKERLHWHDSQLVECWSAVKL